MAPVRLDDPRFDLRAATPPAVPSPDVGKKLRRRYGLMGPEPVQFISPELQSVVIVDDLTGPELHDVGYLRTCIQGANQAAVALENGHIQLFNPASSGVDLLVDAMIVAQFTAGDIRVLFHDTALASAVVALFRDRRVTGRPVGQIRRTTNVGALGTQIFRTTIAAQDATIIPLDIILNPGSGVVVSNVTVNDNINANYYWTERAEPRT